MFDSFLALLPLLFLPFLMGATVSTDWIEVFKAGSYPQGTFTAEDVQSIAEGYDPEVFEAPSTVDHMQEGFAQGWVEDLKAEAGRLYAKFKQVPESFAQAIKEGRLKNRSIELFRDLDGNGLYLKAVSWLGAKAPEVKGLEDPAPALEFDHSGMGQRMAVLHFEEEQESEVDDPPEDGSDEESEDEDGDDETDEESSDEEEDDDSEDEEDEDESDGEASGESEGDPETEEFSHEARSEIERLRAENRRLREQTNQQDRSQQMQEVERFCEERVPPSVRDDVLAIFEALHDSRDTIQFSHGEHEDVVAACREAVDSPSLSYLFQEVGTEPGEGDGSSGRDLEEAVRNTMAEQGLT
jgi:hypothetical protein